MHRAENALVTWPYGGGCNHVMRRPVVLRFGGRVMPGVAGAADRLRLRRGSVRPRSTRWT